MTAILIITLCTLISAAIGAVWGHMDDQYLRSRGVRPHYASGGARDTAIGFAVMGAIGSFIYFVITGAFN